jgi:hypothetical protein
MAQRWSLPDLAAVAVALVGLGVALYLLRGLLSSRPPQMAVSFILDAPHWRSIVPAG